MPDTPDPGCVFTVPADHPCLPGHFPGAPVVPGVVVLDHVLALLPAPPGSGRRLAWVKFVRPLLPGQHAEVRFARERGEVRFTVSHAGETLVRGALAPPVAAGER